MRLLAVAALTLVALSVRVPQGAVADLPSYEEQVDHESESCSYEINELLDATLNDTDGQYALRVLVLLDGPTRKRAQEVMAEAAGAYTPLGVALTGGYRPVRLTGQERDPIALINEARALLGGHVPNGYDAVHVFTTKDISGWGLCHLYRRHPDAQSRLLGQRGRRRPRPVDRRASVQHRDAVDLGDADGKGHRA